MKKTEGGYVDKGRSKWMRIIAELVNLQNIQTIFSQKSRFAVTWEGISCKEVWFVI